jgi:hypothetical protein
LRSVDQSNASGNAGLFCVRRRASGKFCQRHDWAKFTILRSIPQILKSGKKIFAVTARGPMEIW